MGWSRLLRRLRPRRVTVAGRLALVFCGLAGFSTALGLALQDRALDRDLERAARARLERSAQAADRLLRDHLHGVAERYLAISRTPEFRANLEIDHATTLRFYAGQAREYHGAELVAFQAEDGRLVAASGPPELVHGAAGALRALADDAAQACIELEPLAASEPGRRPYVACRPPHDQAQAAPVWLGGSLHAVVAVPLRTGTRRVGTLLAAEALGEPLFETWSSLCGAEVRPARAATSAPEDRIESARHFPGGALWISSSLETERLAVRRSRHSLIVASLLALGAAFGASLGLARSLSRPLRAMQAVTEEIRRGDLSIRLGSRRNDELGDLARALDSMLDRLDESRKRLRRVQQLARFGDWSLRFESGLVEGSPELRRALGIPGSDAIELPLHDVLERIHPDDRSALRREIERCREREGTFQLQVRSPRGAESAVLLLRGRARRDAEGALLEGSVQDLTEKLRVEEQIRYLSYHDPVTGLGNARFFRERLQASCASRRRFAVLVLGLDQFQLVNETHGHSFGDAVLRSTASRLLDALPPRRGESRSRAAIARLGGDEFGLLLDAVRGVERARSLAETVLDRVAEPHLIHGEEIVVTASIGICLAAADADPETLLRNCDSALQRAKEAGRNRAHFFDALAREESSRRLRLEGLLRRALREGGIQLHYQPRIAAASGAIVCFEALLRWTDSELGAIPPSEFIPIAEQSGLIEELGRQAVGGAFAELRRWSAAGHGAARVSINLSPQRLHAEADREIAALLQGLDPRRVELEVTESGLLRDEAGAIGALRRLRRAGFRISLDDFGSGYSSLSYLRVLPIDAIKIDRSFVGAMAKDPQAAALIASIVAMARTLGLGVVAEGVETPEQRELLVEMGCDELQGFLLGPAVPGDEALRLLSGARDRKRRPPRARPRGGRRPRR